MTKEKTSVTSTQQRTTTSALSEEMKDLIQRTADQDNLDHFVDYTLSDYYLNQFDIPFKIIAVTETWINDNKGLDFYLDGYNMTCVTFTRPDENNGDQECRGVGEIRAIKMDKNCYFTKDQYNRVTSILGALQFWTRQALYFMEQSK